MLVGIERKLHEAKAEDADARAIGAPLGGALAIAARKSVELEKQRGQVERAQEKLDNLQARATEADKKVSTLRAEALAAARPQDGRKLSPRDNFEKIAMGLGVVERGGKRSPLANRIGDF